MRLRYDQSGRYSFFLQSPAGKRIPMERGSTVGSRLLRGTYFAPVVQNGKAGSQVAISALTKGTVASGTVLRVILRKPDGALEGQSIAVKP